MERRNTNQLSNQSSPSDFSNPINRSNLKV